MDITIYCDARKVIFKMEIRKQALFVYIKIGRLNIPGNGLENCFRN